jgi:hypothetical protein
VRPLLFFCRIGSTTHQTPEESRIHASLRATKADGLKILVEKALNGTSQSQKEAFRIKFATGLLNPFSGMNVSVRLGELACNILCRWPIKPLPPKPESGLNYLTIGGRAHWLMLRESMFSLYRSWKKLPTITVVSDGSWSAADFYPVFSWWPVKVNILSREQIIADADAAGERELAQYAEASAWGLKVASIILLARREPVLFVDADILWFADPADLLGPSDLWATPRGVRESTCYQHREMALRFCPKVLQPPYVNGSMIALHEEFLPADMLRAMVNEALADPRDGAFEQTIIATAVKLRGEFFPEKLILVEFDDVHRFRSRDMKDEGYYSRHYVNWMRHLLYRDAFKLRLQGSH